MSTLDLSLLYAGAERNAIIGTGPTPLRLVLLPGEALGMPRGKARLRVLSGTAWITRSGMDIALGAGESLGVTPSRDSAVISGLGGQPLLVELA